MEKPMTMNEAVAGAQLAATVAIVLTFLVYWRQLIAMQSQVVAARDASRTQNLLLYLIDYIQRPEHRQARQVLTNLAGKPLDSWDLCKSDTMRSEPARPGMQSP